MTIQKKQKILFNTMLVILPIFLIAVGIYGYIQAVLVLRDKVFTDPNTPTIFLVQPTAHLKNSTTTKQLQIEYSVLKVPAAGTTAAKK